MKVLIAEDDPTSMHVLETCVDRWGYEVVKAEDGAQAWEIIQQDHEVCLAVIDWMMPGMDGTELCRRVRDLDRPGYFYMILLTAKALQEDIVLGLKAGADDYVTKPFDQNELRLRVRNGERVLRLERALSDKVTELQDALSHVRRLKQLLPICMDCKKVRDDGDYWLQIDEYLVEHTDTDITHSLCPDCLDRRSAEVAAGTAG